MSYHVVDPGEVEPMADRPSETRSISDAAGLSNVGLRLYRAAPGEQLPLAYHYHDRQEEVFHVIDGTLRVETPEGEYAVEAGEFFAVDPGSPHRAFNPEGAEVDLRAIALGAPVADDAHPYEP